MDCDKYLNESIRPAVDGIIKELIKDKPDDPIPLMIQVLEAQNGNPIPPLSKSDELELTRLRVRWKKIESERNSIPNITIEEDKEDKKSSSISTKNMPAVIKEEDSDSSSESDDDTETFSREALLKVKPMSNKPPRSSVSAEVIGLFNKREEFKPIVIPKDDDTKLRIKNRLKDSFMFKNLEEKDLDIVVDAMKELKFKEGETIISQGDDGNELYVLESGECQCVKLFPGDEVAKKLREYFPGEAFGELALLYNAPRAATIGATENWTLFALDRQTFNNIVKNACKSNREIYDEFLGSVDLLSSMGYYDRISLSDALKKVRFTKDQYVIKEGEPGDAFYFVFEGEAVAEKIIDGNKKKLMDYKRGDYFGERALITNEPRAASIKATSSELVVAKLEIRAFKRLFGLLKEIPYK